MKQLFKRSEIIASFLVLTGLWLTAGHDQLEGDTLWHIRIGEWIWQNRSIPKTGIYSWTADKADWHAHEWLWEVMAYGMYRVFDFVGLWFLTGIGFFLFGGSLFYLTRESRWYGFFLSIFALFFVSFYFIARPHALAFGFFAIWLLLLDKRFFHWPIVWVSILSLMLGLFWANIHASVVLAPFTALIFFFFTTSMHKTHFVAAVFSFLGSLVNPFFISVYPYAFFASRNPEIVNNVSEWFSPNFHHPLTTIVFILFFFFSMLALYLLIKHNRFRPYRAHILLFFLFFLLFLSSIRNYPYFLFMAVWLFSIAIRHEHLQFSKVVPVVAWLLSLVVLAQGLTLWPPSTIETSQKEPFPVQAVQFLKEHGLTDHVLAEYFWGGYLIYEYIPTFIDGRADMYVLSNSGVMKDFNRFKDAKEGKMFYNPIQIVQKYHVHTALLFKDSLPAYFLKDNGWRKIYEDHLAEIWVHPDLASTITLEDKNE